MKKSFKILITVVLIIIHILSLGILNVFALEDTDIFSNEALVVNIDTDEVLYSKNTNDESVQIASLTKLMTYVLSVENIDDLSTKITVPEGTKQDIIDKEGSNAGLEDGYEYSALDLLYGLMLPSGCDAADVLAKYVADGDYDKFVEMMNDKAEELGMEDSEFYSASGLEENGNNNMSTEQDLYILAKYAYGLPHFKEIIGTEFYDVVGTKGNLADVNTVRNTNYMMGEYNGAEYYYIYSLGGKTGNLSGAGRCLVSFAEKGDLEVVAITLGVPGQHSNYHLNDHRKLFDYVFEEFSQNITIDIGSEYKSVDIGEKIQIVAETSGDTEITWTSSNEEIAEVNEYGVVTGKKLGQAKIIATTSTGNKDYAYVSVGFYNGIDIKYSAGPSDPNGILGYGELDWEVVKDAGIDFAVIRAGYALGNSPDSDPYFVTNIKNAFENDMNVMVSFDGYATAAEYAEKEAEYLTSYLDENIPEYLDKIELPIVYNLYNSSVSDPKVLTDVIFAFKNKMAEAGYDIVVELGRTALGTLDLSEITGDGMDLYIIYRPYVPDFETRMAAVNGDERFEGDMWQYRSDAYFGAEGISNRIIMSVMYMDYASLSTSHEKHDESLYPAKPEIKVEKSYTYTGDAIEAEVLGYDPDTMDIEGNVAKNAGTYEITVSPKTKWKDGSKESVTVTWEIKKAEPSFNIPQLKAESGTALSDIKLPDNFYWQDQNGVVSKDNNEFVVRYIPDDTENYNFVEIKLTVEVTEPEPEYNEGGGSSDNIGAGTENNKQESIVKPESAVNKPAENKEEIKKDPKPEKENNEEKNEPAEDGAGTEDSTVSKTEDDEKFVSPIDEYFDLILVVIVIIVLAAVIAVIIILIKKRRNK